MTTPTISLPGVTVRHEGRTYFLAGDTFPVKEAIKAAGFRWDKAQKSWRGGQAALDRLASAPAADAPAPTATEFPPTTEQSAILADVAAKASSGATTVVEALAGTGKTSTLEMIAKAHPEAKILLVVFNKTMQAEARHRMPKNVECRTFDSLGFAGAVSEAVDKFRAQREAGLGDKAAPLRRAIEIVRHLGLDRAAVTYAATVVSEHGSTRREQRVIQPERAATLAMAMVERYCTSADDKLAAKHAPRDIVEDEDDWAGAAAALLPYAVKVWDDITDSGGRLRITNGHLTKMWALRRPDFRQRSFGPRTVPTLIMVDEAQDTAPVCEAVMRAQKIQTVWVGDTNQAIYAWRGAVNALENVEPDATKRLPLTQSWRFGPQIAGAGNRFLTRLGAPWPITGSGKPGRVLAETESMASPDAILCRTNGGMIGQVLGLMERKLTAAVTPATRADLRLLVATVRYLQGGSAPTRVHEDLAAFQTWAEVDTLVDSGNADPRLEMLHRIVTEHTVDVIESVVESMVEMGTPRANGAVVVVTAHKAKGLQWANVKIGDDFPQPRPCEAGYVVEPGPEEQKLAYVAVTRAQATLDPGSLRWAL